MLKWSLVGAVLGVLATAGVGTHLSRRTSQRKPAIFWLLGLTGLAPAWLIAFLGLLGTAPTEGRPELSTSLAWILSSAAALLGLILSDAGLRHLRESGRDHRPLMFWLVGLLTFLPAWGIALLGLTVNLMSK